MTIQGTLITRLSRRGRTDKKGFTLLELLVVMIIVGLVAAITTPLLTGSLGSVTMRASAKRIAASFRFARQQSILHQRSYAVILHPDSNRVSVVSSGSDGSAPDPHPESSAFRIDEQIALVPDPGLAVDSDGSVAVAFHDDGSSSGGRILVRDRKDRQMVVDVDLVTGIVTIGDE